MKKQLINKIDLRLCEDDNGDYGIRICEEFDAFWTGIGIFHEIWEHQHEFKHKYFQGDYAMNIGGEMAAMGKMWYYQNQLGLHSYRLINPNSYWDPGSIMRMTTSDMIQEAIQEGYTNFGAILESNVPYQKPTDDGELEYQIDKFWKDVKTWHYRSRNEYEYADEERYSIEYKKSVTFRKIADLHRWGYREAERLVPDNYKNRDTLIDFIDFWNNFTKNNSAEELEAYFKGITFRIYRDKGEVSWTAMLMGKAGMKNFRIRTPHEVPIYELEITY